MNDDKIKGAGKYVEGAAESVVGIVSGNKSAEIKGDKKRVEGSVQYNMGKAEDFVCDTMDNAKDCINAKPVQSVITALVIGFLFGRIL